MPDAPLRYDIIRAMFAGHSVITHCKKVYVRDEGANADPAAMTTDEVGGGP